MTEDKTEITSDRLARLLADHLGFEWATMNPEVRDQWRYQATQMLDFVEQTAFAGLASAPPDDGQVA